MLRGGSWNNNLNKARCDTRNRNNPNNRNNNIGFRCGQDLNISLDGAGAGFFKEDTGVCHLSPGLVPVSVFPTETKIIPVRAGS